jgi:hypothetical protein
MSPLRILHVITLCFLFSSSLLTPPLFAQNTDKLFVEVKEFHPGNGATLELEEKLYLRLQYDVEQPVRFQVIAMRDNSILEVGAIKNPPVLHAPGQGDALAWVIYTNPTHIDSVRVSILDEEWQTLKNVTEPMDVTWQKITLPEPRPPADWVDSLTRTEQRQVDYVYDPSPQKFGVLYDILFFLNLASIPAYLLLQIHMLWRYRYRWRELAVIPIFPYVIVAFYVIAGLSIEKALLVTFLFRYTPVALLWLVLLWLAKRFWQHKLPPTKLYKPPQSKNQNR